MVVVVGLTAVSPPTLLHAQDPITPPPDPRFGAIESFWAPAEAAELNVGWERILFYWSEIQPTGPDDWNTLHVLEEWLNEANAQQRTVLGLLPLCISNVQIGGDGPPYYPMARAIAGGLLFSTLVSLVVLPTIYALVDDFTDWLSRLPRSMIWSKPSRSRCALAATTSATSSTPTLS